jgi:hypothetical protein
VHVVQSMADVGDDAVDVDDSEHRTHSRAPTQALDSNPRALR